MPPAIVINLFDPSKDPLLFKTASEFEGEPGKVYVFAHGAMDYPVIQNDSVAPPILYGAAAIKELILKAGARQDTPVVLVSCDTGKSINGALPLARQLSQWFDTVDAPTREILVESVRWGSTIIPAFSISLQAAPENESELRDVKIQAGKDSNDQGIWKTFRRVDYPVCKESSQRCDSPESEVPPLSEASPTLHVVQADVLKPNLTIADLAAFVQAATELTLKQKQMIMAHVNENQNTRVL